MKTMIGALGLGLLILPGCGASSPPDEMSERTTDPGEEVLLHEFEAAGDSIQIVKVVDSEGREAVLTRDEGTLGRALVMDALIEEHGTLTSLEAFHALAPEGTVPAQSLQQAHEVEARALGRADVSIHEVVLNTALMDKISASSCSSLAFPHVTGKIWSYQSYKNSVSGFNYACLGGDCTLMKACYTASHVCNDSNANVSERNAYDFDDQNPWNVTNWRSLAPNQHAGWYMPAGSLRRYSADGNSASGKNYHLRSGMLSGHGGC